MAHQLSFECLIRYDAAEPGITVETTVQVGGHSVRFRARVDTGASYCIFERKHGEILGLNIESGLEQPSRAGRTLNQRLKVGQLACLFVL